MTETAEPTITKIAKTPPLDYLPLRPGEVRRLAVDTKNVVGLLGLRWASLAKRAIHGRRR